LIHIRGHEEANGHEKERHLSPHVHQPEQNISTVDDGAYSEEQ
jgi:hypothetical protein